MIRGQGEGPRAKKHGAECFMPRVNDLTSLSVCVTLNKSLNFLIHLS